MATEYPKGCSKPKDRPAEDLTSAEAAALLLVTALLLVAPATAAITTAPTFALATLCHYPHDWWK
jgi:hypothetical protein